MRTILYAHMCDGTGVSENVRYQVGLRVSAASEKYEQSTMPLRIVSFREISFNTNL